MKDPGGPASSQPDCFLKARKHPLQGHVTSISKAMPLPPRSSDLRGLQSSLPLSQRQNCFSGCLTQFGNTQSTGQEKKKKTAKDRLKPLRGPSGYLPSDTSDFFFFFLNLSVSELGCFPNTLWYLVFGQCGKQMSFSLKLVQPFSCPEKYFRGCRSSHLELLGRVL